MLKQRLISGTLLILASAGIFWLDSRLDTVRLEGFWKDLFGGRPTPPPGLILLGLVMVLIPLAARELAAIFAAGSIHTRPWLIGVAAMASCLTIYATPISLDGATGAAIVASVLILCFIVTLVWHSRHAQVQGVVAAAGATMFAVAYLGLMCGFWLAMRRWHSAWVILAVILIVKMGDSGAFFTGRAIGKHKLIPWLSPGKTWEGVAGAVIWSVLFAVGFAWLSQATDLATTVRTQGDQILTEVRRYHMGWAALAGVLLALVGHAGDLTMSLFKRDAGLKDSGTLIPGMGGVLDVLDSPLLVAPVAYWMLEVAAL